MSPLRRVGILGDIHAEEDLLATALSHLSSRTDAVLAVGDIVDGPGSVDACCTLLRGHGVVTVRGNHERWFLKGDMRDLPDATPVSAIAPESRAFLEALPATRRLETIAGTLLLCHGTDDDDMLSVSPFDYGYALEVNEPLQRLLVAGDVRVMVCGHSHRRMVRRFGSLVIVNAGTLLRHHEPCFGLVDLEAGAVSFYEQRAGEVITAEVCAL